MEKIPKIGKSVEDNVATPEFEGLKKDKSSEINIEGKRESLPSFLKGGWTEIMHKHRKEFPDDISLLLKKGSRKGGFRKHLSSDEDKKFFSFREEWWLTMFGMSYNEWSKLWSKWNGQRIKEKESAQQPNDNGVEGKGTKADLDSKKPSKKERIEVKKQKKLEGFSRIKKQKVEALHVALRNLDNGEPVDEFREETRRVLYFDEDKNQYFTEEAGQKKYLGIGDIMSDYAWEIKYVPDSEMIEPAYRIVAKKILANETRRAIENVYDEELARIHPEKTITTHSKKTLLKLWDKSGNKTELIGLMAEIIVRELMSRICLNNNLPCVVLRVNSLEDSFYKYDFKIRVYKKNRGVDIESNELTIKKSAKIGFQLKTHSKKRESVVTVKGYPKGKKEEVDEVLLLTITTDEFRKSVEKWLEQDKPSGGPEQFLSRELKVELLKAVTKGLTEITDDDIEKIFPKEETPVAN